MKPSPMLSARIRHHLYVLWLVCLFWPYHAVRWRVVAAWRAMHRGNYIVTTDDCLAITTDLEEHNFSWDLPCNCASCRSYADG